MECLKVFQLELETVEKKKDELDAIVARAPGWQFPLDGDRIMILDESKTKRIGWLGHKLGLMFLQNLPYSWPGKFLIRYLASHLRMSEKAPFAAMERLIKDGVKFEDVKLDTDLAEGQYLCYYVVKLT